MKSCFRLPLPLLLLLIPAILATSCGDDVDCSGVTRPMVSVKICKADGSQDTIPQLTVTVLGSDSVLVNRDMNVTHLSLPLSYQKQESHWVLHYESGLADTIHLSHTNTPYFLSPDCGYQMKQELKSASCSHQITSQTEIKNAQILNDNAENLWIYLE